jgi:hypothetical protein
MTELLKDYLKRKPRTKSMKNALKRDPNATINAHDPNSREHKRAMLEVFEDIAEMNAAGISAEIIFPETRITWDGDYAYVHCQMKVKVIPRCAMCFCRMDKKHDEGCSQADKVWEPREPED